MIGAASRRRRAAPGVAATAVLILSVAARAGGEGTKVLLPGRPEVFDWSLRVGMPPAANWVFVPHVVLPHGFRFRPISGEMEGGWKLRLRFEITATGAVPPGEYRARIRYAAVLDTSPYNPQTNAWVVDREVVLGVAPRGAIPPDRSPYGLALAAFIENRPSDALENLSRAPEGPAVDRLRKVIALDPFREIWNPSELAVRSGEARTGDGRTILTLSDSRDAPLERPIVRIDAAVTEALGIRVPREIVARVFLLASRDLFDSFARLLGAEEPQKLQAFYSRDLKIIAVRNIDDSFRPNSHRIGGFSVRLLFQEYVRFVLDAALGSAPAWIEDASALRFAGYRLTPDGAVARGPLPDEVARIVFRERYRVATGWLPKLLEMDRTEFERDRSSNAALAWHFLAYVDRESGASTIGRYVRALQQGASWREAAAIIYTPTFEVRWLEALRGFDR